MKTIFDRITEDIENERDSLDQQAKILRTAEMGLARIYDVLKDYDPKVKYLKVSPPTNISRAVSLGPHNVGEIRFTVQELSNAQVVEAITNLYENTGLIDFIWWKYKGFYGVYPADVLENGEHADAHFQRRVHPIIMEWSEHTGSRVRFHCEFDSVRYKIAFETGRLVFDSDGIKVIDAHTNKTVTRHKDAYGNWRDKEKVHSRLFVIDAGEHFPPLLSKALMLPSN